MAPCWTQTSQQGNEAGEGTGARRGEGREDVLASAGKTIREPWRRNAAAESSETDREEDLQPWNTSATSARPGALTSPPRSQPLDTRHPLPFPLSTPPFWQWTLSLQASPGADMVADPRLTLCLAVPWSAGSGHKETATKWTPVISRGKKLQGLEGNGRRTTGWGTWKVTGREGEQVMGRPRELIGHTGVWAVLGSLLPDFRGPVLCQFLLQNATLSGMEMQFHLLGRAAGQFVKLINNS